MQLIISVHRARETRALVYLNASPESAISGLLNECVPTRYTRPVADFFDPSVKEPNIVLVLA
jgi:hypothetical protein